MVSDTESSNQLPTITPKDLYRLAPPPRKVPWKIRCRLYCGTLATGTIWCLFLCCCLMTAISIRNYDWYSWFLFRGPVNTMRAKVVNVYKVRRHNDHEQADDVTETAVQYSFHPGRRKASWSGTSYCEGNADFAFGEIISIEYLPDRPWISRIRGMDYHRKGAGAVFEWMVVTVILGGFLALLQFALLKHVALLKWGLLAEGTLINTDKQVEKGVFKKAVQVSYCLTYRFVTADGKSCEFSTDCEDAKHPETIPVFYHLRHPGNAEVATGLISKDDFQIDELGRIIPIKELIYGPALILPLASLACLGWALYLMACQLHFIMTGRIGW